MFLRCFTLVILDIFNCAKKIYPIFITIAEIIITIVTSFDSME